MRLQSLREITIASEAGQIRQRRRTCLDILESCLAQIDAREPEVRAWVLVDRAGARAQATALDEEIARGRWRGPLHGIPIGIKDIIDVAGWPTVAGFRPWEGRIAQHDAPLVARLREAGAVILGKTVTTPFAWIDPPPTRNPWRLDRTPGGSSSGSAAAVACGMCLAALGSQTGGSITRPAAFCGVAGLKPSHGRLSVEGIVPFAPSLDHPGPIARTVGDLAILWHVLSGSSSVAQPLSSPPRLGRLRGLFHDRADLAMRAALDRTVNLWRRAGAVIIEVVLPDAFNDVLTHHRRILAAEAAAGHEPIFAQHADAYPPGIRALVAEGLATRAVDLLHSQAHQTTLRRQIRASLEGLDALITPAALGPAPDPSTTGDPALNCPWSYTGLPTVSFPIDLSAEGLPLAVQLVGPPDGEEGLLQVGLWCEEKRFTTENPESTENKSNFNDLKY
jgi:Asp-tRNA(Asn)/Glu-tRNA(Gln) amidotransferase A subunit family amidase